MKLLLDGKRHSRGLRQIHVGNTAIGGQKARLVLGRRVRVVVSVRLIGVLRAGLDRNIDRLRGFLAYRTRFSGSGHGAVFMTVGGSGGVAVRGPAKR